MFGLANRLEDILLAAGALALRGGEDGAGRRRCCLLAPAAPREVAELVALGRRLAEVPRPARAAAAAGVLGRVLPGLAQEDGREEG